MKIPINAIVTIFVTSLAISAVQTGPFHGKRSAGETETKAEKIKRLKLEVQNLQKLLQQINTDDEVTVPTKPPATTASDVAKKDGGTDVKNEADRRHVENVLKSLTANDMKILTYLGDSIKGHKERNQDTTYQGDHTGYRDIFNKLYRAVKNDAENSKGGARSLGSRRVYKSKRPPYRDLADRALIKARYSDDEPHDDPEGYSERKRTLESRTDRLKRVEGRLLDVLQDGLSTYGITLEDLIADLDRVKERENQKRTLVSDEEAQLESLRHTLHTH